MHAGSLGGPLDDLAFYADLPIVLRGRTLLAYDQALRETDRHDLSEAGAALVVQGATIFVFHAGLDGVEAVPIGELATAVPGAPIDPAGLAFDFDGWAQGADGTVYLLDAGNLSVYRWYPSTRAYGQTIPLADAPQLLAHAPDGNRLYLAYRSGELTQVRLDESDAEQPFIDTAAPLCGLATAGDLVLTCDGATSAHSTWTPDGTLASTSTGYDYANEYAWSAALQRMFFLRRGSPMDILFQPIDVAGLIGETVESPYHGDFTFRGPIRLQPGDGRILTGDGAFFDTTSLAYVASLTNEIDDAVWIGDTLVTIRRFAPPRDIYEPTPPIWGFSEVQAWGPPTYPKLWRRLVPGLPRHMLADGATPIAVTGVGGVPQWIPLSCGNGVIDPYEACDGANLAGQSCSGLQLGSGTLACTSGCELDTSACTAVRRCGNGVVDRPEEVCDGNDLGVGAVYTCATLGYVGGAVACLPDCSGIDPGQCNPCGNGVIDADRFEECDGADLGFATCETQGFPGGPIGCSPTCRLDTSTCHRDCSQEPCERDDDPCTIDFCATDGCHYDPVDSCIALTGYGVIRVTATVHQNGLTGDCAVRCGDRIRSGIAILVDGTYRNPTNQPESCPGERVVIPDEVGTLRPIRGGREQLVPSNLRDVIRAVARCAGFKAKLRKYKAWIRRAGGEPIEGRVTAVVSERRGSTTFLVRRSERVAGPGRGVEPPRGFSRLTSCTGPLRLRCEVR